MKLQESQPLSALLPSGQRRNLYRQRADVLLVPYYHLLYLNGRGHVVVIGFAVIAAVGNDGAFPRFAGQEAGGIADDLGLLFAFLQYARAKTAPFPSSFRFKISSAIRFLYRIILDTSLYRTDYSIC